jgi:hypothetical protein
VARVSLPATATAVAAAQQLTGAGHTRLRRWIDTLAPALVYLAIRQIGLLVLVCMSSATGSSTTAELTSWDGQRFLGIAGGGYDGVPAEMIDRFGALVAITRRRDSWRPWAAATLAPLGSWRTWGSWRCGPGSGTAGSHCSGAGGASRSTAGLRRCASPVRYW